MKMSKGVPMKKGGTLVKTAFCDKIVGKKGK